VPSFLFLVALAGGLSFSFIWPGFAEGRRFSPEKSDILNFLFKNIFNNRGFFRYF
jgi:hypothetical protein